MKVLIASAYLYNKHWPEFTRNKTGFGIMVNNIVETISKKIEVVYTSYVITDGRPGIIEPHSWLTVLWQSRFRDWIEGIRNFIRYPMPFSARVKLVYYSVNKGYFRNLVSASKPDIIHIHGVGLSTFPFIQISEELGIPYIISLHGSLLNDDTASKYDKDLEREIVRFCDEKKIPITVVSTGIKTALEKTYLKHTSNNIFVVKNGTKIDCGHQVKERKEDLIFDLDKFYYDYSNALASGGYAAYKDIIKYLMEKRKQGFRIVSYVGTILENKNQMQLVRVINNSDKTDGIIVVFAGEEHDSNALREYIIENKLTKKCILMGFCDNLEDLWQQTDLNILISKHDGFGLSIIEGYCRGIPSLISTTIDAFNDLYNDDCCISTRLNDTDILNALLAGLERDWNKETIKNFGVSFSLDNMADSYIKIYELIE